MLGKFLCVLSVITPISGLFFGCCGAPQIQTGCCSQTSWAYAPPRIIGYERIPLYAKVPVAAPPPAYVTTTPAYYPPSPPSPPIYNTPYEVPMSNQPDAFATLSPIQNPNPERLNDGLASAPASASASPNRIPQVIQLPSTSEGDTIIIETDDEYRKKLRRHIQPPPPPQAPNGYLQQPEQIGNYAPQQGQFVNNVNNGQIENGVEVSLDQINSNTASLNSAANYGAQSQSLLSSAPSSGFESSGLIAPAARRLRLHKNFF